MSNRTGLMAAIIVIIIALVAGVSYYIGAQNNTVTNTNQDQNQQNTPTPTPTITNNPTPTPTATTGATIPDDVRTSIANEYPNYHIDDLDRETEGGVEYYEVELDHNQTDEDIHLYYDLDWNFVRVERD